MMRVRTKRLDRLRGAIAGAPVLPHVLDEAYEWFTMFGELSDEDHIAEAVMRKAMRGGAEEPSGRSRLRVSVVSAPEDDMLTVREPLFCEALDESPFVRKIARAAIGVEVAHGGNVESPGFAARHGLPVFGTVGMHVLGYPRKWVAPPYEFLGARLFTRWDELRARIDHRNPRWFDPIGEALSAFRTKGELPKDEFVLEFVLVDAALDGLRANKKGRDVREVMAWFDDALWREGERRDAARRRLSEAAVARQLP